MISVKIVKDGGGIPEEVPPKSAPIESPPTPPQRILSELPVYASPKVDFYSSALGSSNVRAEENLYEVVFYEHNERNPTKWDITQGKVYVNFDECINEGTCKKVYRLTDHNGDTFVCKLSKEVESRQSYFDEVAYHCQCARIANAFSMALTKLGAKDIRPVVYAPVWVVEFPSLGKTGTIEPMLEGHFRKYTNNYGFVHPKSHCTPLAFSHFSFEHTSKKYMVADVQGIVLKDREVYTDPQLVSNSPQTRMFGKCDVGLKGIEKFFETHQCNSLCKMLGLSFHHRQSSFSYAVLRTLPFEEDEEKKQKQLHAAEPPSNQTLSSQSSQPYHQPSNQSLHQPSLNQIPHLRLHQKPHQATTLSQSNGNGQFQHQQSLQNSYKSGPVGIRVDTVHAGSVQSANSTHNNDTNAIQVSILPQSASGSTKDTPNKQGIDKLGVNIPVKPASSTSQHVGVGVHIGVAIAGAHVGIGNAVSGPQPVLERRSSHEMEPQRVSVSQRTPIKLGADVPPAPPRPIEPPATPEKRSLNGNSAMRPTPSIERRSRSLPLSAEELAKAHPGKSNMQPPRRANGPPNANQAPDCSKPGPRRGSLVSTMKKISTQVAERRLNSPNRFKLKRSFSHDTINNIGSSLEARTPVKEDKGVKTEVTGKTRSEELFKISSPRASTKTVLRKFPTNETSKPQREEEKLGKDIRLDPTRVEKPKEKQIPPDDKNKLGAGGSTRKVLKLPEEEQKTTQPPNTNATQYAFNSSNLFHPFYSKTFSGAQTTYSHSTMLSDRSSSLHNPLLWNSFSTYRFQK